VVDPAEATGWIRASVRMAWANPAASRDFVLANAQEMELDVVQQHIKLYVNEFTLDLGREGHAAADALLGRAAAAGITPPVPSLLF
jgi:1,4-dihydroxy-6-naphthoate synthase